MRIAVLVLLIPALVAAGKYDLHEYARLGNIAGIVEAANAKNINQFDKKGSAALHYAAANADVEAIKVLLGRGADVNLAHVEYRTTALHEIARSPSRERSAMSTTVEVLAAAGANPALVDNYGEDALTAAAGVGNGAVVKALLQFYAGNIPEESMQSALGVARERGKYEVISVLESRGTHTSAGIEKGLLAAAAEGNHAALVRIIDVGLDLEIVDERGATALILAAEHGHRSVAELLLRYGSRVDAAQTDGQAPLHLAAHHGSIGMIDLLLSKGANLNSVSATFGAPINRAAEREQINVVEYLLSRGAVPVSVESSEEAAFGSGLAWKLYAEHNEGTISEEERQQHIAESRRLLTIARDKFGERREEHVVLRKKEKRAEFWTEAIASSIAMTAAATMEQMQRRQIQVNQRQMAEIVALKGATSYSDYHTRLASYESIMLQPGTLEPYQLDFSASTYANTESTLGLDVIISEYDRRIALVDNLLSDQ